MYAQYSIRCSDRKRAIERMKRCNIPYAIHYPIPLHLQEVMQNVGSYKKGDFEISEMVCDEILSLPFSPFVTTKEQDQVIECINE